MKLFCGIDLHAENLIITILNEQNTLILEQTVANDLEQIKAILQPYQQDLQSIVMESSKNGDWLMEGLTQQGFTVHQVEA